MEEIVAAKQRDEGVKLNWVEIAQELAVCVDTSCGLTETNVDLLLDKSYSNGLYA